MWSVVPVEAEILLEDKQRGGVCQSEEAGMMMMHSTNMNILLIFNLKVMLGLHRVGFYHQELLDHFRQTVFELQPQDRNERHKRLFLIIFQLASWIF